MVGKARVHKAMVTDVQPSEKGNQFYKVTIEYKRRMRTYSFWLREGDSRTKRLLRLINVSNIEKLKGKEVYYIAAEDLKEPGEELLWLLTDKERTEFYDVNSGKMVSRKKAKKMIEKLVFSEF